MPKSFGALLCAVSAIALSLSVQASCLTAIHAAEPGGDVKELSSPESRQRFAEITARFTQDMIEDARGSIQLWKDRRAAELKKKAPPKAVERKAHLENRKQVVAKCDEEIKKLEVFLSDASGKSGFKEPYLPHKIEVGSMGKIASKVFVVEVIDENNVVITGGIGAERDYPVGKPDIDANGGMSWRTNTMTAWMEGIPTDGMDPGDEIKKEVLTADPVFKGAERLGKFFEAVGTKKYKNEDGETEKLIHLKVMGLVGGEPSTMSLIGIEREKLADKATDEP